MKPQCKKPLSPSKRRLLSFLKELQNEGYEVTSEGLSKLVRGVWDRETAILSSSVVFGQCPSLSSKRIKGRLTYLLRHGYIGLSYSEKDDDYFLFLKDTGEKEAHPEALTRKIGPTSYSRNIRTIHKENH